MESPLADLKSLEKSDIEANIVSYEMLVGDGLGRS
jgi:hypothetical protein